MQHPQSHLPSETLLVVGVNLAGFLQLGDELVDGLLVLLGVEMNDECVDHFEFVWIGIG